jgi:hypothetical protein
MLGEDETVMSAVCVRDITFVLETGCVDVGVREAVDGAVPVDDTVLSSEVVADGEADSSRELLVLADAVEVRSFDLVGLPLKEFVTVGSDEIVCEWCAEGVPESVSSSDRLREI